MVYLKMPKIRIWSKILLKGEMGMSIHCKLTFLKSSQQIIYTMIEYNEQKSDIIVKFKTLFCYNICVMICNIKL